MAEQAWTNLKGPAKMFRKAVTSYRKTHPTQKPDDLMTWCIDMAGTPRTILDPFAGSGTTAVAALARRCSAVLIEREEAYCEMTARRLDALLDGRTTMAVLMPTSPLHQSSAG